MRKYCTRINAVTGKFCRLEMELTERDGKQRLSICGSAGALRTKKELRSDYRELVTDYMMDERGEQSHRSKHERRSMIAADMRDFDPLNHDCIGTCTVGRKEYYLSVHSCGQIREELARWFPDFAALFPWHLNDMRAECIHQEARGETYQKDPHAECFDCPTTEVVDGHGRQTTRGYRIGSAWTYRQLPAHIIELAESVPDNGSTFVLPANK